MCELRVMEENTIEQESKWSGKDRTKINSIFSTILLESHAAKSTQL